MGQAMAKAGSDGSLLKRSGSHVSFLLGRNTGRQKGKGEKKVVLFSVIEVL